MPDGIHDGHRQRVIEEFLAHGFDIDTPPHKIVEMLLFFSIPRKDTNEMAHELVNRFGTIEALIEARPEDIMSVKGAGGSTAALLKFIHFISNYYINEKRKDVKSFNNFDEICRYLLDKYLGFNKEVIAITTLDNRGKFLGFDIIGEGDIASVGISVRQIIEVVIKRNAAAVVISHNHPGGTALPSSADISATKTIFDALERIDVKLLDHIIIADNDYVSLVQSHQYGYVFKGNND